VRDSTEVVSIFAQEIASVILGNLSPILRKIWVSGLYVRSPLPAGLNLG
jgi:hypothetical protein